jgi:hypothetical protein
MQSVDVHVFTESHEMYTHFQLDHLEGRDHLGDLGVDSKGTEKLPPCLIKQHVIDIWGVEIWLHALLTLAQSGGEWSASSPGRFTSKERTPIYRIGGCMGPGTGLNAVKRISYYSWVSNSDFALIQPVN